MLFVGWKPPGSEIVPRSTLSSLRDETAGLTRSHTSVLLRQANKAPLMTAVVLVRRRIEYLQIFGSLDD